jgi:hypothetical protein
MPRSRLSAVIFGLALAALSACAAPSPDGQSGRSEPIPYLPDAEGLQLTDRPLRIDFGRTQSSTLPAMTKLVGQEPRASGACADPGVSFADWPDGTRLVFARSRFLGWERDGASAGLRCTSLV